MKRATEIVRISRKNATKKHSPYQDTKIICFHFIISYNDKAIEKNNPSNIWITKPSKQRCSRKNTCSRT